MYIYIYIYIHIHIYVDIYITGQAIVYLRHSKTKPCSHSKASSCRADIHFTSSQLWSIITSHSRSSALYISGCTKRATFVKMPRLRLQSSEGKFTMHREIKPVHRSLCRRGSCALTEVARLAPSAHRQHLSLSLYMYVYIYIYIYTHIHTIYAYYVYTYIYI